MGLQSEGRKANNGNGCKDYEELYHLMLFARKM